MAVNNLNFGATVDAWVRKTNARMVAVFRESTQRVVSKAQERIPVDTGFARASIQASLAAMPQIDPTKHGVAGGRYRPQPINAVLAQAQIGQTIYVGWTASYVGFLEHGSSKKAPSGFVRISAMEWPKIVRQVTAEAKARVNKA